MLRRVGCLLCCLYAAASSVKVSLQANWPESHLLVEILESIALEDDAAFFPLVGLLSDPVDRRLDTPANTYETALAQVANYGLPAASIDTLTLGIANREATPRLQAFYETYAALRLAPPAGCTSFVVYSADASLTCDPAAILASFEEGSIAKASAALPFEHATPSVADAQPIYTLYGDPTDSDFHSLHTQLYQASQRNAIQYRLRWKPPAGHDTARKLPITGYGAGLDIKKSDYLAVDDRQMVNQTGKTVRTEGQEEVRFGEESIELDSLAPLTRAELFGLGEKAVDFIIQSPNPLATLVDLSQNFPKYAHALATDWVPEASIETHEALQSTRSKIEPGQNLMWLNGARLALRDIEPFALIRRLREEHRPVRDLMELGMSAKQAVDVLSHPALAAKMSGQVTPGKELTAESLGYLFDASDVEEDGLAIVWWNDLEKDRRYKSWPADLSELARPRYGQLPQVRLNVWNLVFVLDLGNPDGLGHVVQYIMSFVQRGMPFRVGMVPLLDAEGLSTQVARLTLFLFDNYGKTDAMQLLSALAQAPTPQITLESAELLFGEIVKSAGGVDKAGDQPPPFKQIISEYGAKQMEAARAYCSRLGVQSNLEGGALFINGHYVSLAENVQQALQATIPLQLAYLQQELYNDRIAQTADPARLFYDLPGVLSIRSTAIFESERNPLRVDRVKNWTCPTGWVSKGDRVKAVSIVVWSQDALHHAAAEASLTDWESRWCLLELGVPFGGQHGFDDETIMVNGRILANVSASAFSPTDLLTLAYYEVRQRIKPVREALADVMVHGRNNASSSVFVDDDKTYDDAQEATGFAGKAVAKVPFTEQMDDYPDIVATVTSILVNASLPDRSLAWLSAPKLRSDEAKLLFNNRTSISQGQEERAWARLEVAIDPISETAATWASMLNELSKLPGIFVRLHLNPPALVAELPIKRFYRHSFTSSLSFDVAGSIVSPALSFRGMPKSVLLTLGLETPKSWLAFPKESVHDLDNIQLGHLSSAQDDIEAVFELENIIVEGHCRDVSQGGQPPRGLQLVLQSLKPDQPAVDSIIMANLGYVQLKANPGLFDLSIREEGRGRDVFEMVTASQVAVTSFEGTTLVPEFLRKAGQENVDLLDMGLAPAVQDDKGVLSKLQTFFGKPATAVAPTASEPDQINVFTVASGLLYERMALIMIVSVLRHTETPVKFWFISNFLSPSFKTFIPHMAAEYGFDYELVTYKWPHWLRAQREKQRTIWGYKILFLDVLFPLELDRVIFVDSDQIVRTDLKQLVDLDLKGAPYAYTPMCDSRQEMEGFRFWKTGYWRDHLRGLKYMISALYVIDLQRFRQIAAGDRLRGQYQALSADPNSLANLDQDLPNNMQHKIPIYELDQSWLWCETWCSDESLKEAKTIDLCNNPQTHEPKLLRAKRIIPEWTEYDNEVAALAKRVADRTHESVAFGGEAGELAQVKLQEEDFQKASPNRAKSEL